MNLQTRARAVGKQLTLQDVYDEFMLTYYGGLSEKLAEQQLDSLVYGKGDCRDLAALDSEFDRLSQQLYPGSEGSKPAISLLARIYSGALRRGDEELWGKAMDAQPSTVDEWKVAAQTAFVIIETKKSHQTKARQEARGTFYPKFSPSTAASSSSSASRSNSAVQVQNTETEEETPGREPGDEVAIQKAEAQGPSRPPLRPRERLGVHLTFAQRTRLSDLGKCWICMERGHRSFECEKKGKVGYPRKPTELDLKA